MDSLGTFLLIVGSLIIIADDVVAAVQDFFSGGCLPRGYTSSFLALIPKTEDASKFSEFRPISLCHFI